MKWRNFTIMGGLALLAILLFWRSEQISPPAPTTTPPQPISKIDIPKKQTALQKSVPSAPSIQQPAKKEQPQSPDKKTVPTLSERDTITGERVYSFYSTDEMNRFIESAEAMGLEVLDHMEFGHTVRVRITDSSLLDAVLAVTPSPVRSSNNYHVSAPDPAPGATFEKTQYTGFGADVLAWLGVPEDNQDWGKGLTIAILDTPVSSEHGRAVQSMIVGSGDTLSGISPAATIITVPVLTAEGTGDTFTLAKGIIAAVDQGADIINMSVGSYGDSDILRAAIAYAVSRGVVLVAAAGNDSLNEVCYPARYDGVLAVAAIDATGQHMEFSNSGTEIDLSAPGLAILAASTNADGAEYMSGTSMAAPLVSGAIAALAALEDTSPTNAAALLLSYANDEGTAGDDPNYGEGILNIPRTASRNEAGVYDVAIGQPWITSDPEGLNLHVFVENRGTEPLNHVTVSIDAGGLLMTAQFYSVKVAATAEQTLSLNSLATDKGTTISISLTASIEGHKDSHTSDNSCRGGIVSP